MKRLTWAVITLFYLANLGWAAPNARFNNVTVDNNLIIPDNILSRAKLKWGSGATQLPRYYDNNAFTDNLTLYGNDLIVKGSPWVDVRAFGAVGDGVTDDSSAVQAALTASVTSAKPVYIPRGSYYMGTTGLTIAGGYLVYGDGPSELIWDNTFTGTGITITGNYAKISRITLVKPWRQSIPANTVFGIDVQSNSTIINQIRIYSTGSGNYPGWYDGIKYSEWTHELSFSEVLAYHLGVYGNVNALRITGGNISAQDYTTEGIGLFLYNGAGNSAHGTNIEGTSSYGVYALSEGTGSGNFSMFGGYIEGQSIANIYVKGTDDNNIIMGVTISGVLLNGSLTANYNIMARYVNGLVVTGNDMSNAKIASVYTLSNVDNVLILGNQYRSSYGGWVPYSYASDTTGLLQSATGIQIMGTVTLSNLPTSALAGSKQLYYNTADNVVKYAP